MMTVLEKADLLQNVEIFREIRTQSLARVAALAQEIRFEPRQRLFVRDEAGDALFVLLEGEVAMTSPGEKERMLGPMQAAGALALLANQPQRETATASGTVRALRIGQQDLFEAMAEDFAVTRGILRALARSAAERG